MNRRGAALLLVLWLVVLLATLAGTGMTGARQANLEAQNRLALVRAGWAREACLEILVGRAARDSLQPLLLLSQLESDSIDLGGGMWCSVSLSDPGSRLNINVADTGASMRFFGDTSDARLVLGGRPWPSEQALPSALDAWLPYLTTRGPGRITLTTAPAAVLGALPGVDAEGARAIERAGTIGKAPTSLEELLSRLPIRTREQVMANYSDFASRATLYPQMIVAEIEGHTAVRPVIARMHVSLVPAGRRLAVIRREVE